jgi:NAD(P)-dependent dehydrogenase (short-subunit alcohol dehydrogenase family)
MAERTALVIGASRGIGLGLVKELAARGWRVIGTRRSAASDKGLEAFANQSGGQVRMETVDLEDAAGIDALAQRLSGETLDLLFVNAGMSGPRGKAGEASREAVAQLFVTNTVAPMHVAEAFLDRMRNGPGVIAMMTSGLGSVAISMRGPGALYSASKAALNRMTRNFIGDIGGRKLTVLSISPGWVRTDMGGPSAMLSVEDSARGVIDVVEAKAGTGEHGFYSHDGSTVPW